MAGEVPDFDAEARWCGAWSRPVGPVQPVRGGGGPAGGRPTPGSTRPCWRRPGPARGHRHHQRRVAGAGGDHRGLAVRRLPDAGRGAGPPAAGGPPRRRGQPGAGADRRGGHRVHRLRGEPTTRSATRTTRSPPARRTYMVAGGADSVCRWAHAGYFRLGALTALACSPFDRDRSGVLTGEGGAALLLEPLEGALRPRRPGVRRGARLRAQLRRRPPGRAGPGRGRRACMRRAHRQRRRAGRPRWTTSARTAPARRPTTRPSTPPSGRVRRPAAADQLDQVDARPHHGRGQRLRRDRVRAGHRARLPAAHDQLPHPGPRR